LNQIAEVVMRRLLADDVALASKLIDARRDVLVAMATHNVCNADGTALLVAWQVCVMICFRNFKSISNYL
jgi:hypothetical protein